MRSCWRIIPGSRPPFDELAKRFFRMLDEDVADHYVGLNEPYEKWNATNAKWIRDNQNGASYSHSTVQFIEDQLYFTKVDDQTQIKDKP